MSDTYKHEVFTCTKKYCNFICYTLNQLHEHMLDKHSAQCIPKYSVNGFYTLHSEFYTTDEKEKKDDST